MLSRRTRAAASREAAAAAILASRATAPAALAVSSTDTPTGTVLDDSYCASPKRKDCKLDSGDSPAINVEMNVRVSIQAATTSHKRYSNSTACATPSAKTSPAKGKRQSPQAITQFFLPQAKQTPHQECVQQLDVKHSAIDMLVNIEDDDDASDKLTTAINNHSPRQHQLKKQANANKLRPSPANVASSAISEPATPLKNKESTAARVKESSTLANELDTEIELQSPGATPIRNGVAVKQNTPHRMVITSPVKVTRRFTNKPTTVSGFSQLKIGDSPTNKKTATKKEKKTRRRLQINGSENVEKSSLELKSNDKRDETDDDNEVTPIANDILLNNELKSSVIDTKKPILNSSIDPTAQQNTTNNFKSVPARVNAPKQLTDYFPIRRSVRKTKQEVEREFLRQIEKAVDRDVEEGLLIKHFGDKGRGIVAARPFARGEFVVEYLGDLVDQLEAHKREEFYAKDPKFGCYMYYFKYKEQQWCIDATAESGKCGRLLNHSRNGNLVTKIITYDKRPRLILIAKDDIEAGTELTYDYGDRRREALLNHPWLAY